MLDHLAFIHQQFAQRGMGIALQRFRSLVTLHPQRRYSLEAYNESLYLTNATALPEGTRLVSDTNSLEITPAHRSMEALEEFSGLVHIELPENLPVYPVIEFIQIVRQ